MLRTDVKPWVMDDVTQALKSHNPLFRPILGRILFDLHYHLPANLALYRPKRIPGSPRCFWYERIYLNDRTLQHFSFVVRDVDPGILEVVWVVPTA